MSSSILLTSCLATGTWLSMWFPDPCAPPRGATGLPPNAIVLCAPDECAAEQDHLAAKCLDNHLVPGQRAPLFIGGGAHCLCPCPAPPATE